jgi:hypothetical protein
VILRTEPLPDPPARRESAASPVSVSASNARASGWRMLRAAPSPTVSGHGPCA